MKRFFLAAFAAVALLAPSSAQAAPPPWAKPAPWCKHNFVPPRFFLGPACPVPPGKRVKALGDLLRSAAPAPRDSTAMRDCVRAGRTDCGEAPLRRAFPARRWKVWRCPETPAGELVGPCFPDVEERP